MHNPAVADGFFLPTAEPERFVATPHTAGPWGTGAQHGGPPSALLARAIERHPSSIAGPVQLARLTVEILGSVPVAEVTVRAAVVRPGRSVELIEAELHAGDRPVLRARAWRIRRTALELPTGVTTAPEPAPPRPAVASRLTDPVWQAGYLRAIEWRFVQGHFEQLGPALVWTRLRVPLVAGEQTSALQRVLVVADSGNGLSRLLDVADWWFINTELTVHLHRQPVGEWVCVRAGTTLDGHGVGLAETDLYDETGRVGRGAQALMVGPRP